MFERFTDQARRVVVLANEESRLLNHNYLGTEHLLLGLLAADGIGGSTLRNLGVSLDRTRDMVAEIVGRSAEPFNGHAPMTPRAKRVFELSLREALHMGHNYIGTEHILLGLLREGEGLACRLITTSGIDLDYLAGAVVELAKDPNVTPSFSGAPPDGSADPLCPTCRRVLEGHLKYRVIDMENAGGDESRDVMFAFCGRCGSAIEGWLIPKDPS